MKLWVFGQSMSLPHKLEETQGWPYLLSQALGCEYINFAEHAADNFFIYHTFLENYKQISADDVTVIGWSHPSRKSFVYDSDNPTHVSVAAKGLIYQTKTKTLFRSQNLIFTDWTTLKPQDRGVAFYDHWFREYYSDYEQRCNFQSYMDSVQLKISGCYVPFYFSKESVSRIGRQNSNFQLEFTMHNKVAISNTDSHMNALGHELWSQHLLEQIKNESNISQN